MLTRFGKNYLLNEKNIKVEYDPVGPYDTIIVYYVTDLETGHRLRPIVMKVEDRSKKVESVIIEKVKHIREDSSYYDKQIYEKDLEKIVDYCRNDVRATKEVFETIYSKEENEK